MSQFQIPDAAFKSKLLDRDFHERLIADLPAIAAKAGVNQSAIVSRLSQACTPDEVDWVRNLRNPVDVGLIFMGTKFDVPVDVKMTAITAVCLRNYTDARMMTVQDVVKRLKDDTMPAPTVLLIPNFCLDKANGGDMPTWEVTNLMGLLLSRSSKGLKTVLHASSMAVLQKQYGDSFKALLEVKYSQATPDGVDAPVVNEHHEQE